MPPVSIRKWMRCAVLSNPLTPSYVGEKVGVQQKINKTSGRERYEEWKVSLICGF
jgi:hypothetical protein